MLEAGELADAETHLRNYLQQGEHPELTELLAVALSRQGRLEEAERYFLRTLELDPQAHSARQQLGRLYLLSGRKPAALEQLRQAAQQAPLERDLAMSLASLEMEVGSPAAAEAQLGDLAERFQSVRARFRLAQIATQRGDLETALEQLRTALELAPNSEELLITHARIALMSKSPVPAILALEPLQRMYPSEPEYPYLMGVTRLQAGDTAGAVEALQGAMALEPDRAMTLVALGLALNQQKRYDEAETVLTRSLRLQPENVEALAALAESEDGLSRFAEAEVHVQRALAKNPDHPTANLVHGILLMRRGDYPAAVGALKQAVAADPDSPKAHYQLSLAYSRSGDREGFQKHLDLYREALAMNEQRLEQLGSQIGVQRGGMGR